MKKFILLSAILFTASGCAFAGEPLILAPLDTVLSTSPATNSAVYGDTTNLPELNVNVENVANIENAAGTEVYEGTYTPYITDPNMVPQNAAAKGEPIPQRKEKWINIRTKQRSQGNDYWNPGGKGNKTAF